MVNCAGIRNIVLGARESRVQGEGGLRFQRFVPPFPRVCENGRPHQILLTHWPGFAAPVALREGIAARCPTLTRDGAVDRAWAAGPPGRPVLTPQARTWAETAHVLHTGAFTTDLGSERIALEGAARVLTLWASHQPRPVPAPCRPASPHPDARDLRTPLGPASKFPIRASGPMGNFP